MRRGPPCPPGVSQRRWASADGGSDDARHHHQAVLRLDVIGCAGVVAVSGDGRLAWLACRQQRCEGGLTS
jgi:hypothetical protein